VVVTFTKSADQKYNSLKEEPQMKSPFENFLVAALADFEKHLKDIALRDDPVDRRMRGARQFADFLIGNKRRKGERTSVGAKEL